MKRIPFRLPKDEQERKNTDVKSLTNPFDSFHLSIKGKPEGAEFARVLHYFTELKFFVLQGDPEVCAIPALGKVTVLAWDNKSPARVSAGLFNSSYAADRKFLSHGNALNRSLKSFSRLALPRNGCRPVLFK